VIAIDEAILCPVHVPSISRGEVRAVEELEAEELAVLGAVREDETRLPCSPGVTGRARKVARISIRRKMGPFPFVPVRDRAPSER
jgi:hypothetical protein